MVDQTQYHHQADQSGAVALEDTYQDEGYDYGAYDDGTIDPNTGMPYATGADGNKGKKHLLNYSTQRNIWLLS